MNNVCASSNHSNDWQYSLMPRTCTGFQVCQIYDPEMLQLFSCYVYFMLVIFETPFKTQHISLELISKKDLLLYKYFYNCHLTN